MTPDKAKDIFHHMVRLRLVEEAIADRYTEYEMRCPVHLCIGQEAAEVASTLALDARDYAVSGHRPHGHYLAKGGNLNAMIAELHGRATGCASGVGGSMHLIDLDAGFLGSAPIVGSTMPIAVGAAFGTQCRGEDRVTMLFFGDGATEAGVFHESLNFAVLKNLPIVFVCENNLYSVYSPLSVRQPKNRPIADLARSHGMTTIAIDGDDPQLVFDTCSGAVAQARSGEGPSFIELSTYRWREHCGPNYDNDIGYRSQEEYQAWRDRDPVARYEKKLLDAGVMSDADVAALRQAVQTEIDEAFDFATSSPYPDDDQASAHVYA